MEKEATKSAKRVVTLDEVVYKDTTDKTKAILACIPGVAIIMFLIEKDDLFTRYMAAQFSILSVIPFALFVTLILAFLGGIAQFVIVVMAVFAIIQVTEKKRFDVPVVSQWAISLMNKF